MGQFLGFFPVCGGRSPDIHIVRNSGFLDLLEPFDRDMTDRAFKADLALKQGSLSVPPRAAKGIQMEKRCS